MLSTAITSTKLVDNPLKVKIALNDLEEKHEISVKSYLLAAYMLSYNQEHIIQKQVARYFAEKITELLEFTQENRATKDSILKIFEFNILKEKSKTADFLAFLSIALTYSNSGEQRALDACHKNGQAIFKSFHDNNLIQSDDLKLALRKLEIHKKKLSKSIKEITSNKMVYYEKSGIFVTRRSEGVVAGVVGAFLFACLDSEKVDNKSPLNILLVFIAFFVLQVMQRTLQQILADTNQAIKNIPLSLTMIKAKREASAPKKTYPYTAETSSSSTEATSSDMNFEIKLELQKSGTRQTKQNDTPPAANTEPNQHPKKLKRSQQPTVEPEPEGCPVIEVETPSPADFDARFSGLTTRHMTVIDPDNLGRSRHYWGLWNQPKIESDCQSPEDLKICGRLFDIFKTGNLANKRNSQGIKYIANLNLFEVKGKGGPQRVFADGSTAITHDKDTLLEFNEFDRKGRK